MDEVSSFKPQLLALSALLIVVSSLIVLLDGRRDLVPLLVAFIAVTLGIMALSGKVIHKRGNEYRISTLYYSELVMVEDVCMTVTSPGPLWLRFRIHLRRPARFGWTVTFVPIDETQVLPANGAATS